MRRMTHHIATRRLAMSTVANANATATTAVQRHGNCTNRNLGKWFQKRIVGRVIRRLAAAPKMAMAQKLCMENLVFSPLDFLCQKYNDAPRVHAIKRTATYEAILLNASCSESAVLANRKFSDGVRPAESAPLIFTQRCS